MNWRRRLLRLYAQLPTFECVPGCSHCCGPTPCAPSETALIAQWLTQRGLAVLHSPLAVLPTTDGLTCVYAGADGCSIYPVRPFMCRLYGSIPKLRCPLGRGPAEPLSESAEASLMREYLAAWV